MKFLLLSALIALIFAGGLYTFYSFQNFIIFDNQHHKIYELQGNIKHFDEVLTMSARMAVATGDQRWEKRYRLYEPKLNHAIQEARNLTPHEIMSKAAYQLDQSNKKLIEMENQAFRLVNNSNLNDAKKILFSDEYEKQKRVYEQNINRYIADLNHHKEQNYNNYRNMAFLGVGFTIFILTLIIFGFLTIWQMQARLKERKQKQKELNSANQLLLATNQQLKATEQQVRAMNQQLDASNQQLTAMNQQLTANQGELNILNHNLHERIKELNCLYGIAKIVEEPGISMDKILKKVVNLIPPSWQYPEVTCARLTYKDIQIQTGNFRLTKWIQSCDIIVHGQSRGLLEICYLDEKPKCDEGPFLMEERDLIINICERLGRIIERKMAEKKIIQHQNNLREIFDAAPVGMLLLDENIVIKRTNKAAAHLIKKNQININNNQPGNGLNCFYSYGDPRGCGYHDECKKCFIKEAVRKVFKNGKPVKNVQIQKTFVIDKRPVNRWLEISMNLIHQDNKQLVLMIFEDITRRKKTEAALNKARKDAENANKAKSQFLANMSHEIRTPMNAIIGFTEMLAEESMPTDQKNKLSIIRDSGHNLLELVDDILDFSKIEAGKLELEKKVCSLAKILNSIESMMKPKAAEKGIDLQIIEKQNLPARIYTDPTRLKQCLINLVSNAVKFTEEGYVNITAALENSDYNSNIRFDVLDTGIGIPKNRQNDIFDSFKQADGTTTRKFGGTGLGLTITKQLAQLLGGKLTLTSQKGKGSTFTLIIPAGLNTANQSFLDRHNLAQYTKSDLDLEEINFNGKVLIAEDVKTNQMLIKSLLNKIGLDVVVTEDGCQAVQKALNESFDVILMDIQMPNMDGYEAARTLRDKQINTPIIALTANAMKGDDIKCTKAGCNDYLTKPIDKTRLIETLRNYLDEENSARQSKSGDDFSENKNNEKCQKVIQWDKLIERGFDEELIKEVVSIFVDENSKYIKKLKNEIKAGNIEKIKFYAHGIKGSAANVGALQLSQYASKLELMARQGHISAALQCMENIECEYNKIKTLVSKTDWIETAKKKC